MRKGFRQAWNCSERSVWRRSKLGPSRLPFDPPLSVLDPAYLLWKHKYRVCNQPPSKSNPITQESQRPENLDFEIHGKRTSTVKWFGRASSQNLVWPRY